MLVKEQSKAPRQNYVRCPVSCNFFCSSKRGLLARDLVEENSRAPKQKYVRCPVSCKTFCSSKRWLRCMLALVLVLLALLVVLVAACRRALKGASKRKVLAPVASVECSLDWQLCKIFRKSTPLKSWHYRFRTEVFSFGKNLAHEQDSNFCQIKDSQKTQSVCFSELLPCEVFIKTQIFINFFSAVRGHPPRK